MNDLVNHNHLLENIVGVNDIQLLQQLVECTLNTTTMLCVIRKTKNYAVLTLLEPFLKHVDSREFYPIIADAVKDGALESLEKHLYEKLTSDKVSYACGLHAVDFDLIPKPLRSFNSYIDGVYAADDLESFLKFYSGPGHNVTLILSRASRVCARRIITHYGFSDANVGICVCEAFQTNNKDTLLFIREQAGWDCFQTQAEEKFLLLLILRSITTTNYPFIVDCFSDGIITLSEEGWQTLKKQNPKLYDMVQNDV